MIRLGVLLLAALLPLASTSAGAAEYRLEEVPVAALSDTAQLKPRVVSFNDHRKDELADAGGLMRFEDWARAKPLQRQFLSPYPSYVEPTVQVNVNGIIKPYKEKLHIYVGEARFVLDKPIAAIDVRKYVALPFVEKMDPAIKHRAIAQSDLVSYAKPDFAHEKHPERTWCEAKPAVLCLESRYTLEGKLPAGVKLANKLKEGGTRISETFEFQSELRALAAEEVDQAGLAQLTGIAAPVGGVLEQNIFHVNQVMQFGKLFAVFQQHPTDPAKSVVSAYIVLGVESDVLEKRKEYENVPVLRNMVPVQVLTGNSSFNTGNSISSGLPNYARNSLKAIASLFSAN